MLSYYAIYKHTAVCRAVKCPELTTSAFNENHILAA